MCSSRSIKLYLLYVMPKSRLQTSLLLQLVKSINLLFKVMKLNGKHLKNLNSPILTSAYLSKTQAYIAGTHKLCINI